MAKKKATVFSSPYPYNPSHKTQIEKQNFFSGILTYGNLITKYAASSAGIGATIYTVPAGKTFFLVSCTLSNPGVSAAQGASYIYIDGLQNVIAVVDTRDVDGEGLALSFSIPLKIEEGRSLKVLAGVAVADGVITGYEVPTSAIPNFV